MAGTVVGSIEHFLTSGNQAGSRDAWVLLYNFFTMHPAWTRIALQYGSGASGTDFTGGANPAGENAFAVFENTGGAYTWFVLFQWGYNNVIGAAPGAPGDAPSAYGTSIQMAFSTDESNVWAGGTGNVGADSKSSPVWVASTGDIVVHPRANGLGGGHNTNKESMAQVYQYNWTNTRFQLVGDDDFVFIAVDVSSNAAYDSCIYMGPYTPVSGVTVTGPPLCMIQSAGALKDNLDYGTTGGTSQNQEGGCAEAAGDTESRICRTMIHGGWFTTVQQPNNQRVPPTYDMLDLPLFLFDGQGGGSYGQVGNVDLVKMVYGPPVHNTTPTSDRVFIGSSTTTPSWAVPWDGVTVPGSGTTRAGVQF